MWMCGVVVGFSLSVPSLANVSTVFVSCNAQVCVCFVYVDSMWV